jgi:ATP-binding cassette subfamily B protein
MIEAAGHLGFNARAVKGPYEALLQVPTPAIAVVMNKEGRQHFVVLHRVRHSGVVIADPAQGIVRLTKDSFVKQWSGYLLLVEREEAAAMRPTTEAMPAWRRLLALLAYRKGLFCEGFLCAVLMSVLGIALSYFVQHLVDSVLVRGETQLLNGLGTGMLVVIGFRTCFGALRQRLLAEISRKVDLTLISAYMRHVLRLPANFFETRRAGEILSRLTDAQKIREAIGGAALTALVDVFLLGASLAVLWIHDVQLALISTMFVPALAGIVLGHHRSLKRRSSQLLESSAKLSAQMIEDIAGVETTKAFNFEQGRTSEGEVRLLDVVRSAFSLQRLSIRIETACTALVALAGVVVLWYGGHRVMAGLMTVGQLMFFYTLLGYVLDPLGRLSSVSLQLEESLVAIDRVYQIMELDVECKSDPSKARFRKMSQGIELRDVSFRYGCRSDVLKHVNLRIPAGATVAIVGESGSGKSTLLKLLMQFYLPTAGRILLDAVDYRDYDLLSYRSRIGMVSQEPFVFAGNIKQNIALGCAAANMEDIVRAARAAALDEFIETLPERYETQLGERGMNLSGGQRQRLAIARALLRKPELVIFDEATSHLDTATENVIRQSLASALADTTVLIVAHRLSTVMHADMVYVLNGGQVVEEGKHHELLNCPGAYAALWRSQFGESSENSHLAGFAAPASFNGRLNGATRHHA